MSKEPFYILRDELRPYIMKNTTTMHKPIDVQKQVAVLYYLGIAFRIAKCTVCKITYRVTKAINIYLGPKFTKLPIIE